MQTHHKRLREIQLSLFDPDYTWRRQVHEFIGSSGLLSQARILDFGAGNSPYRRYFDSQHYVTADVSGTERAPDYLIDPLQPSLPLESGSFDLVLCMSVLEHVQDFEATLSELYRLLRPGGHLLMEMPFISREHEIPNDFRRFTTYGLERALAASGFEIEKTGRIGNAWYTAFTLLNERHVNSPVKPPLLSRIFWRAFQLTACPILNLTLFRGKHEGVFHTLAVTARKIDRAK